MPATIKDDPEKLAAAKAAAEVEVKPDSKKETEKTNLDGLRALLGREFPGQKFTPPKTEDDKKKEGDDDEPTPERNPDGTFVKKATEKKPEPAKKPAAGKTPPKPAPKRTPSTPPTAPPLTADQITEAAARGAAKGLTETKATTENAKAKSVEEALSSEDKDRVEVLRHMESTNPAYKGVAEKFIQSTVALDDYAKKWEKDHPGQEFDDKDPEHEAFFSKNDVDWKDGDYRKAEVDMLVNKVLETKGAKPAETDLKKQVEELRKKVELQESGAAIATVQTAAALQFWNQLGDEFKDIILPDGSTNTAKLVEMQKADPEGYATRIRAAQALNLESAEIHKVYRGLATFNPATNRIHKAIADFGSEMEAVILAQPAEDQLNDQNLPFLPSSKFNQLPPSEQAKYWTLGADELIEMRAARLAKLTKQAVDEAEKAHRAWAKSRGIDLPEPAAKPAAAQGATVEDDERDDKPRGPSSAGDSRAAATRNGKGAGATAGSRVASIL